MECVCSVSFSTGKPQMNDGCGLRVQIVFIKKNGTVQLWLDKNRLTASGPLKSTVVRIWNRTPFGRPHKVYFVSLACLPSVFVQFFCNVRHSCHIQSISTRSLSPARNHRLTVINTDVAQILGKKPPHLRASASNQGIHGQNA